MANLTLRLVKGSPLTYAEVDDNFTALNDATGHFKNALINGNFDIWQRGTSFSLPSNTGSFYTADRWFGNAGVSGVATASRQSFTLGQTDVPGEPRYFYRHTQSTATTVSHGVIHQRIEGVRTFAGNTITWTIWAKVSSGTKSLVPQLTQVFGTGGSPSADVNVDLSAITLTTSWQKFDLEFAVPSISGKTIGTNDNNFLQVRLGEDSGFSTFTADFAQAQLEKGDEPTEFERRPIQIELGLCQRYFTKTYNIDTDPGTSTTFGTIVQRARGTETANAVHLRWQFPVVMRTTPTITVYSQTGATGNIRDITAGADLAGSITDTGSTGTNLTNTAATTSGDLYSAHGTASAEL